MSYEQLHYTINTLLLFNSWNYMRSNALYFDPWNCGQKDYISFILNQI
jgi:hypothetical protein